MFGGVRCNNKKVISAHCHLRHFLRPNRVNVNYIHHSLHSLVKMLYLSAGWVR